MPIVPKNEAISQLYIGKKFDSLWDWRRKSDRPCFAGIGWQVSDEGIRLSWQWGYAILPAQLRVFSSRLAGTAQDNEKRAGNIPARLPREMVPW